MDGIDDGTRRKRGIKTESDRVSQSSLFLSLQCGQPSIRSSLHSPAFQSTELADPSGSKHLGATVKSLIVSTFASPTLLAPMPMLFLSHSTPWPFRVSVSRQYKSVANMAQNVQESHPKICLRHKVVRSLVVTQQQQPSLKV